METSVLFRQHDAKVAILTLNRPEKRNALTIGLMESLCNQIRRLESDPACRVVILQGAGPVFCAGLDLNQAADLGLAEQSAESVAETFRCVANTSLVTIAAAQGAAMAGGAGLMSACDLVVASDDLKIGFPEVRRGLVPALVSDLLRNRLRDSEMRELFLLGEQIDVIRASQLGLVHRIVPRDDLLDQAVHIAETVCRGAPEAIRRTKKLIRDIGSADEPSSIERVLEIHTSARTGQEAEEGLKAFHEKRKPNW